MLTSRSVLASHAPSDGSVNPMTIEHIRYLSSDRKRQDHTRPRLHPSPGPGPVTAFVQPLGIGLPVALAFVVTYLTALHKPQPHNLPVGVVAPPGAVAKLQRPRGCSVQARPALPPRAVGCAGRACRQVRSGMRAGCRPRGEHAALVGVLDKNMILSPTCSGARVCRVRGRSANLLGVGS
jgi:hypothetical protein